MADQDDPHSSFSALEYSILTALGRFSKDGATTGQLAQHMRIPEGTIKFGLQWLLSYDMVRYQDGCYHLRTETNTS